MKPRRKLFDRPLCKLLFLASLLVVATGGKSCYDEPDYDPDPGTIKYRVTAAPNSFDLTPASPTAVITLSADCVPVPKKGCGDEPDWQVSTTLDPDYATVERPPAGPEHFKRLTVTIHNWDAVANLTGSAQGVIAKTITATPTRAPYPLSGNQTVTLRLHPPVPGGERTEEPVGKPRLVALPPGNPMSGFADYPAAITYTGPSTTLNVSASGDTASIRTYFAKDPEKALPVVNHPVTDGDLVPMRISNVSGIPGRTYTVTVTFRANTTPPVTTVMVLTTTWH